MHVTGRVDSVSESENRKGKTQAGKDYSFWQQTMTLALGGHMVEVVYRADSEPSGPLCPHGEDEVCRVKVGTPRIFNGRVSYDAVL